MIIYNFVMVDRCVVCGEVLTGEQSRHKEELCTECGKDKDSCLWRYPDDFNEKG